MAKVGEGAEGGPTLLSFTSSQTAESVQTQRQGEIIFQISHCEPVWSVALGTLT